MHSTAHLYRASQEGVAFAFRYGLDIMRSNGINPSVIRAGKTNMFLSNLFTKTFVSATGVPVELYESDGSIGAAIGAGIGAKVYKNTSEAFQHFQPLETIEPVDEEVQRYNDLYLGWKKQLLQQLDR